MAGRFHRGGARGTTAPCAVRRPFQSRTVTGDKLALFGLQIRDFPRPITLAAASQRHERTLAYGRKTDIRSMPCWVSAFDPLQTFAASALDR